MLYERTVSWRHFLLAFPVVRPAPPPSVLPPGTTRPSSETPELPHPVLWRASQVARVRGPVWPSGFAALDAALPGGGWPARELTELLLPHPGVGELRLLAPALAAQQAQGGSVLWFDPPAEPSAWVLEALGIRTRQLVLVRPRTPPGSRIAPGRPARAALPAADVLWALEQALASGQAGAALAWLPVRLPADALRRLQLAAQAHDGPAFLLRGLEARQRPSAAPLRLVLRSAGPDALRVHLLKRRGPPLAQPLDLALPSALAPAAQARAAAARAPSGPAPAAARPLVAQQP